MQYSMYIDIHLETYSDGSFGVQALAHIFHSLGLPAGLAMVDLSGFSVQGWGSGFWVSGLSYVRPAFCTYFQPLCHRFSHLLLEPQF